MMPDESTDSGQGSNGGDSGAVPGSDASSKHESAPGSDSDSGVGGGICPDTLAERYEADGFYFPIRVMSESEAATHLVRVIEIENAAENENRFLHSKAHLAYRFIDDIARIPAILDCVECILGPDILLWGSNCFVKAPGSPSYVSWHQDLNYWGLDGTDAVSVWLALSASNEANGCVRFVPGSHRRGPIMHRDTFELENMLSRGQELQVEVDEDEAVPVRLAPGEISLHHGRMFHASGPNPSGRWRAGLALRYITPSTRQIVGERDFAQLVRGVDRYGHFDALPRPRDNHDPAAKRRFDFADGVTHIIFSSDPAWLLQRAAAQGSDAAAGEEPDAPAGDAPPEGG